MLRKFANNAERQKFYRLRKRAHAVAANPHTRALADFYFQTFGAAGDIRNVTEVPWICFHDFARTQQAISEKNLFDELSKSLFIQFDRSRVGKLMLSFALVPKKKPANEAQDNNAPQSSDEFTVKLPDKSVAIFPDEESMNKFAAQVLRPKDEINGN